jgi:hypothetical protein
MGRPAKLATAGDIVTIRQADYCYGLGDLRLRLTRVGNGRNVHDRAEWVEVEGVEVRTDDTDGSVRKALVRVAALVRRDAADR